MMKYLISDHLALPGCFASSIVAITDNAGNVLAETRYMPYGEPRADVGSLAGTDKTYTGQRDVPDTGLMDYRARMYSPWLGRFIQPDTIVPGAGISQAWNRYAYVGNEPIGFSDPTGHIRLREGPESCTTTECIEKRTNSNNQGNDTGSNITNDDKNLDLNSTSEHPAWTAKQPSMSGYSDYAQEICKLINPPGPQIPVFSCGYVELPEIELLPYATTNGDTYTDFYWRGKPNTTPQNVGPLWYMMAAELLINGIDYLYHNTTWLTNEKVSGLLVVANNQRNHSSWILGVVVYNNSSQSISVNDMTIGKKRYTNKFDIPVGEVGIPYQPFTRVYNGTPIVIDIQSDGFYGRINYQWSE